eukprot:TRINITY_DN34597_c0_g1_i1.p1 TRINITY_DN34597_c0_g1~~TRINITY_DN34597_c0_g1_i1.p1  ORF type:complete len:410 (+),score=64.85 TRINITY_DN34597_c0_g1_i1:75-1304(+)
MNDDVGIFDIFNTKGIVGSRFAEAQHRRKLILPNPDLFFQMIRILSIACLAILIIVCLAIIRAWADKYNYSSFVRAVSLLQNEKSAISAIQTERTAATPQLWHMCSFNWSIPTTAHNAPVYWEGFVPGIAGQLDYFRKKTNVSFVFSAGVTQAQTRTVLMGMLAHVAKHLDLMKVNWYIGFGSLIGLLRSQSFIPWDSDIDILVRPSERHVLFDYIKNLAGTRAVSLGGKEAVYHQDPETPEWVMLAVRQAKNTTKALWVDLATNMAIDFCFDCEMDIDTYIPTKKVSFGGVQVNAPASIDVRVLPMYYSPNFTTRTVSMDVSKVGWSCKGYLCSSTPPANVKFPSLAKFYEANASNVQCPAFFGPVAENVRAARCSVPRDFSKCDALSKLTYDTIEVASCGDDVKMVR